MVYRRDIFCYIDICNKIILHPNGRNMDEKHFERIGNLIDAFAAETEDVMDMAKRLAEPRVSSEDRKEIATRLKLTAKQIDTIASRIYGVCEDSYATSKPAVAIDPDIAELVPPAARLSLGEFVSLKDKLNEWRRENGYPVKYR